MIRESSTPTTEMVRNLYSLVEISYVRKVWSIVPHLIEYFGKGSMMMLICILVSVSQGPVASEPPEVLFKIQISGFYSDLLKRSPWIQVHGIWILNKGCFSFFLCSKFWNHCFMLLGHHSRMWWVGSNVQIRNYFSIWKASCNILVYKGTDYHELSKPTQKHEKHR